ncbi:hypothetical protein BBJ29_006407 [Phytophthora kernoviae]|uniref:AB hydrolase-1 domain-containing protein n=1 Tax=Phytophthora kernoviae TaxID=325452 RepID=A0A3F2RH56_9STRA|nr:hypothetical protein BBP00_00007781 [Phytophthora kernoviae]RLN67423.1 hypothetical protein BBJ29_006407 [Phytophthora kernoviae]
MAKPGVTLLFAHANGFCKQVWDPVIRRMKSSPLLQGAVDRYVTYDQPFQGANRDESVPSQVYHKDDDPKSPRVKHPLNDWPEISVDAVLKQVQQIQVTADRARRPLIGIGHSMGAAAMWATEARHPGTFDGLILFEPIYGEVDAVFEKKADFLVSITLARENKWPSLDAAASHFNKWENFASWDREVLAQWVKGGVVFDEEQKAAVLACHPHVEAAVYSGGRLCLTESELAAPCCPISFHSGDCTKLFDTNLFESLATQFPSIYKTNNPLPNTSHLMLFEDPEASTNAILADLERLPIFQPLKSSL